MDGWIDRHTPTYFSWAHSLPFLCCKRNIVIYTHKFYHLNNVFTSVTSATTATNTDRAKEGEMHIHFIRGTWYLWGLMESLATSAHSTGDQNTQLFAAAFTNGQELLKTDKHTHISTIQNPKIGRNADIVEYTDWREIHIHSSIILRWLHTLLVFHRYLAHTYLATVCVAKSEAVIRQQHQSISSTTITDIHASPNLIVIVLFDAIIITFSLCGLDTVIQSPLAI